MAAKSASQDKGDEKVIKPNVFMRIGLFVKQIFVELRKVVVPTRIGLLKWTVAVLIFVLFLMLLVTAMDYGLGKLMFLIFG